MKKWIAKKMRIYRHTFLENLLSFIVVCIATLILLWLMLWNELNTRKPIMTVFPQFEFVEIIEDPADQAVIEYEVETIPMPVISDAEPIIDSKVLNARDGVCYGPSGKEKYYNLPMDRVVQTMRDKGYTEADYPYMIRDDGVKCLGDYVMVAASLKKYRRGDIIETSLGQGIVVDTGAFATEDPNMIDIAVDW